MASKFRRYPPPKPLTPDELAWFEELIRLQTNSQPAQLEMNLDTGMTEFGAGFDGEEDDMPMMAEVKADD